MTAVFKKNGSLVDRVASAFRRIVFEAKTMGADLHISKITNDGAVVERKVYTDLEIKEFDDTPTVKVLIEELAGMKIEDIGYVERGGSRYDIRGVPLYRVYADLKNNGYVATRRDE